VPISVSLGQSKLDSQAGRQALDSRSLIAIVSDLSERKRLERQLLQAQKMETLGQLTVGIAHDFNNLFTVITGNVELLEAQIGENKPLRSIQRAATREAATVSGLLSVAREKRMQTKTVDLHQTVTDMNELLIHTLGSAIDVTTILPPGLAPVLSDPTQLENALLNLAINARDAMPSGGSLTIECANLGAADIAGLRLDTANLTSGAVCLNLRDTGEGMFEETLQRAFEPFFTTKQSMGGNGFGLSMVFEFARQSGGYVGIDSTVGIGTTVHFYLPVAEALPVEIDQSADPNRPARGTIGSILVLDDDDDVREFVCAALERLGYRVISAANTDQAHAALNQNNDVWLLLTDVVLGDRSSGPDFAAIAAERQPTLRILFMSGYTGTEEYRLKIEQMGSQLLYKPFRHEELANAVDALIDHPQTSHPVQREHARR